MITEYFNNGDLHEYLVLQRSKTIDLTDFLHISMQIVSGMIYLSEKKFLHNDLSTRNIFISEHLNIKITNIARYRRKYHLDYYKLVNRLLPVRWMSIESLLSGIYSEMSDVWSFGVLLWEMFSYGIQPYYGQTNPEVIEMIRDRKLLTCPINCPKRIYALMCSCWEEISDQRPTFMELMRRLRQFEEASTTSSSIDDELISVKQMESPTAKYRSLMSPNGRIATQSIILDRNSIRLEV
jgi:receptor tyrosine kinase-like orphan receptor 1